MIARDSTRNHEIRYKKGSVEYIEYIGTNKKWIYPQIQMKVKCKFAANLQIMDVWSYPPQKQPFPLPVLVSNSISKGKDDLSISVYVR